MASAEIFGRRLLDAWSEDFQSQTLKKNRRLPKASPVFRTECYISSPKSGKELRKSVDRAREWGVEVRERVAEIRGMYR